MGEMLSSDDLRIEFTYEEATNTGSRQTGESAADEILQEVVPGNNQKKSRPRQFQVEQARVPARQRLELEGVFFSRNWSIINNPRKAGKPGLNFLSSFCSSSAFSVKKWQGSPGVKTP
jgi:hypothetical protein